ncbi:MAG: FAD-dependent oxidoreductase [Burkholderiales bacterium]|nr:FAD-dependent oxidoreductase [Burkholderiales bacterium]
MIVGQTYVSSQIDTHYDAIVIGSGLGGLTTAALMAKAGKKVLVLERHYTAGGFTHSFKRRGYEWDVGVHYIGEVHNPNSPLRRVFDVITDGNLQWAKMDAVYDKIIIQGTQYNFVAGAARFKEELLQSFPHGAKQIDAYLQHIRAATNSLPVHLGKRYLPTRLQPLAGRFGGDYFSRTTLSVMADFIQDPKLASVLCGQWGDYGLPPAQSSFAMHAVVAQHYLGGASFPVGGASQIAHHIEPVIQRAGGAVVVGAEVEQIMVEGDRAKGVRMANGDEIWSQHVISAAGLHATYGKLLPDAVGTRLKLRERLSSLKPSVSHLGLYIGLHGSAKDLGLEQANKWVYQQYDHDASLRKFMAIPHANANTVGNIDFPLNYISFPSSKDPAWDSHYPGKSTIDVISLAPYEWFKRWADKPWKNRGADYDDFKAALSEKLLADVYQHAPQVRGKVDYFELSTPLSTAHFSNYAQGQVYGLEHTPERFAQSWVKPHTPIKGLYLTGQDILFCGVASAMMSGVMTATSVLGAASVKVLPEFLGDKAKWIGNLADKLPVVGRKPAADAGSAPKLAPPDPVQHRLVARCTEVLDLTADVKAFRFVDDAGHPMDYKPGQFVTLELEVEGKRVFRSYTMSSTPTNPAYFELTVKRVEGGAVSNWLCDHLQVGATLRMTGPHGKFTCAPKPRKKLLFLSAGSGVTPMLSMARWIRDQQQSEQPQNHHSNAGEHVDTDVVYFHCARTANDLIFGDEVQAMAAANPRFVQHVSLTRSTKQDRWKGLTGYLTAAMLKKMAPDFAEREVYVCGPSGFMDGSKAIFQHAGFAMAHFHEESFGTASTVQASGGTVCFEASGIEVACSGQQSILDLAEQAGCASPVPAARVTAVNARCAKYRAMPPWPTPMDWTPTRWKTAMCSPASAL